MNARGTCHPVKTRWNSESLTGRGCRAASEIIANDSGYCLEDYMP